MQGLITRKMNLFLWEVGGLVDGYILAIDKYKVIFF